VAPPEDTTVALRTYIEALFAEGQRATEMAERERFRAAEAITTERRQANEQAEREREKAAQALAIQLTMQIEQGDRALKDHIEQQFAQLQIMLDSTRREIDIRSEEQQKAITKAEVSTDNRFHSVNELRAQMADLITGHQESLNGITSRLMPREVAEARIEDLSNKVAANTGRLDRMGGQGDGERTARSQGQASMGQIVAAVSVIVAIAAILVGAYT